MSGYPNGDWHNVNGGGLPFRRPPTVDEALPYSPFTSIVPFSPDVIPFPINDPPTPPTTMTADQQAAGRKAVGILNEEIRGPPSTAHHLENTLRELRSLLGDPREMTEFHFKPTAQLATPPPDSPTKSAEESTPTTRPKLSPFASMLLKQTEVHYQPTGARMPQRSKPKAEPPRPRAPATVPPPQKSLQQVTPSQSSTPSAQRVAPSSTPTSSSQPPSSSQPCSGPAVIIKPSTAPKHELRLYENVPDDDETKTKTKQQKQAPFDNLSALRPEEREISEQKIEKLQKLVNHYCQSKDELESEYFERISCLDSDITVMTTDALNRLYNRVMAVYATKCFSSVSVDTIIRIHTLCEPSITASDQSSLFTEDELDSWTGDIRTVESGLKSARLALTAMLEGPPDRRTSPEDLLISIIQTVKRVLDTCIFPVLAASRRDPDPSIFAFATNHSDGMAAILRLCTSVQGLLARAVRKVSLPDSALNAVEFLALALLVQQNSDSEKDSALGIQQFEALRRAAMDVLTNIFASRPDHQQYVIGEILNSLEKLPDKGPNTRQFKSIREQPIMTVSAIFLQFIQVAATNTYNQHSKTDPASEPDESEEDSSESEYESDKKPGRKVKSTKSNKSAEITTRQLMSNARQIAQRIAKTLTDRALNVSKSADKPFRNLLEMFVDDFCNVLGSPEWPAANLLLVQLLTQMARLLTDTGNRDMALSILGTMGGGIIEFKKRVRHLKRDVDVSQSNLNARLHQLTDETLGDDDTRIKKSDLLILKDPYRLVIESLPDFLNVNDNTDDLHLLSVRGCYVSCWLDTIYQITQSNDDGAAEDRVIGDLRQNAESMVLDSKWSSREYKYQNVSETQSRLASGIITLKSTFCQHYTQIVFIMFKQIQDGGATQKATAIRNIESFLGKDPHAISEQQVNFMVHILNDNSAKVRAQVLQLISKCLDSNPAMERLCLPGVLRLTTDSHNEPKKKAIGLLKIIYKRSESLDTKIQIVTALLPASQDHEKTVSDMARQALEEVWLKVLDARASGDENRLKLQRTERVSLIVQTVRRAQRLPTQKSFKAFESFFVEALAKKSPNASVNFKICRDMVADLVEGVISPDSMPADYTQDAALQTLSIFARVSPEMFALDQIQRLKLYIIDPKTADDIEILRSTVTVFRFVIPHLSDLPTKFADEVWKLLSEALAKLARSAANGNATGKDTLLGVVHCLWIMRGLATNGVAKLLAVVGSTLVQLMQLAIPSSEPTAQDTQKKRVIPLLVLIGIFGKVCDWSEHTTQFHTSITNSARKTIANRPASEKQLKGLLTPTANAPSVILLEAVRPFTKQSWDLSIRECALCAVGEVCQGSPSLFQRSDVETTFKVVFKNDVGSLKRIALTQFHDFLVKAEGRSESESAATSENGTNGNGRLGITFQAGDGQVTTNYLARKFLQEIVDIALQNDNELALVATNTIVSVSRQGLVHPKEVGPALIALGSSSNLRIAETAAAEHKEIHSKHETMFEKEYMVAVKMTFQYQKDVFQDSHGMSRPPECKPKMAHVFNVMKNGSRKTLKRFIENFPKLMDFNLIKFDDPTASLDGLLFARFSLENLALFDVVKLEDVAIITNALENIVLKNTGPTVGVAIETEMPRKTAPIPQHPQLLPGVDGQLAVHDLSMQDAVRDQHESVSDDRLLQLTRACVILHMMWETRCFIRKAYNLTKPGRIHQKDYQKSAVRNNLIKAADLWDRFEQTFAATESRQTMIKHCHEFADLLEVDKDAQFDEEEEEDEDAAGYATPEENEERGTSVPTSGRGRKRKSSASLMNTPKKARGRPVGSKNKKRTSKTPEGDDWE